MDGTTMRSKARDVVAVGEVPVAKPTFQAEEEEAAGGVAVAEPTFQAEQGEAAGGVAVAEPMLQAEEGEAAGVAATARVWPTDLLETKELVDATFQDFTSLKATFDHCTCRPVFLCRFPCCFIVALDESVQLAVSRGLLTHLASSVLVRIDPDVHAWKKDLLAYCLNKIKPRILSFEEADIVLREVLCDLLMDEEDYIEAAKTLAAINLESSARQYTDEEKAEKYVKIAELYLQEDETVDAENFINRASRVIHAVGQSNWPLKLRYQVSYARILDAKRKFLDAALRYYEFSQSKPDVHDLLQLLSKAVTCAILAAAGPQRSRLLATLYKDERVKASEHAAILEKMYMEQLLRRSDIAAFDQSLLPHQKAQLANGFTVLEQAFLEHNMLAVSKIYTSMRFQELGTLLGVDATRAEKVYAWSLL
ncbi:hypothetical protein DYB34_002032 [Aphanomyces astaci]|uniref:COP9 signalosome complex subunit 4 n=1 Tax=Aphanomyces astaci TaxID=112090 RepID=A0A418BHN8_APHAT|nr:hypothetical protein DYB34_002032 [Aphanomyces astaci]